MLKSLLATLSIFMQADPVAEIMMRIFFKNAYEKQVFRSPQNPFFFLLVLKNISDENTAIKIIFSFKKPENGMTANDKKQAFS